MATQKENAPKRGRGRPVRYPMRISDIPEPVAQAVRSTPLEKKGNGGLVLPIRRGSEVSVPFFPVPVVRVWPPA